MNSVFQECYTPETVYYSDEVKSKGKTGVFYLADREYYTGLGFNTKQISPNDAPKSYTDLLNPKWKGRMSIAGESIGPRWIGVVLDAMGRDYLEKLSAQEVKVQNMAPVALLDLIISGEVPLSPTIGDPNIFTSRQKGAPVDCIPLEPAMVSVGSSGMTTKAPHPHTALLFLDYLHSKDAQILVTKGGLSSPREDVVSREKKFKKSYFGIKMSPQEYEKEYNGWEKLMMQLFMKKR
jgi:iron(III) transport system substrate-binding protein